VLTTFSDVVIGSETVCFLKPGSLSKCTECAVRLASPIIRRGSMSENAGPASRWCIPPVMLHGPGETLEGVGLLSEFQDDCALGLLLWRTVRDVALWADASPPTRQRIFADKSVSVRVAALAATNVPAAVAPALDTITSMLAVPDRADAGLLTVCCLEVAAWARHAGMPHTAISFAQAGALASPEFAEAALQTGIAAAAIGQGARAETWLRRAVGLARREQDHTAYTSAFTELGRLYEERGDIRRAVPLYRLAYLAGRRFAVRTARLHAAHRLFRIASAQDCECAGQFALAVQQASRPDIPGALGLLLDVARFWTDRGEKDRARVVLRRLFTRRSAFPRSARLTLCALTARGFAAVAPRPAAEALTEAQRLMQDTEIPQGVQFAAAVDLAHAAHTSGNAAEFTRAKHDMLRLAPADTFPHLSAQIAELWPERGEGSA
jgi:tetratricopeptide (TPR) repeat protein